VTYQAECPPLVPGAWPLLGHLPRLGRAPLDFFEGLEKYGPLVRIKIGRRTAVVVTRPDLARRVLVAEQRAFDKGGPIIEALRSTLGNGLASCPAADHPRQRKLMQPAFHPDRLARFTDAMSAAAAEVAYAWRPGETVQMVDEVNAIISRNLSRTLVATPDAEAAAERICELLPEIASAMYWRGMMSGRLLPRLPLPVNRRLARLSTEIRSLLDPLVTRYRATGGDHQDLMSDIVHAYAEDPDPYQAVYDQTATIFGAALETTSNATVWTLRLLAEHPDVNARVIAELDSVLAGRLPTHEDLSRLSYTRQVLRESMRLCPPIWLITRTATTSVEWADGYIPAGTDVLLSPWALHRDADVFPDPGVFDPDRWDPERMTTVQREGDFALGAGRRKCIGDVFGLNAATVTLAVILTRWDLHHRPGHAAVKPRLMLMPPRTPVTVELRRARMPEKTSAEV